MKRFALAATLLASTANLTADPLSTTLGLGSWAFSAWAGMKTYQSYQKEKNSFRSNVGYGIQTILNMAREGSGDRSPVNQEEIKFWRTKWDALRFQYPQTTKYAITSAGSAILGAILLRKH